jgi:CxxC motif-containing protein (DUF1111 family)
LLFVGAAVLLCSVHITAQRGPAAVPVGDLTPAQRQAFDEGSRVFARVYTMADGLGPVFNEDSCADCHAAGGASNRTVSRFGRVEGEWFNALESLGGSLIQSRAIGIVTTGSGTFTFRGEQIPAEASVTAQRRSSSIRGLGYVDAVPDSTWFDIAAAEWAGDPSTAGQLQLVFDEVDTRFVVGKFGWKAQVPTLRDFAGDAMLNEMGITNPLFRDEVCPQGNCDALGFNPAPALNDDGRDIDAMTNFMTMLAAPVRGEITEDVLAGEQVFHAIGCAACHRASIQTGPSPIRAFDRVVFSPYSDFLLHDMGSLGDGISQGMASGRQMRTAPLWGTRNANRFLHDGSATTVEDAIRRHDGQGRAARERFDALDDEKRARLVTFVRSL